MTFLKKSYKKFKAFIYSFCSSQKQGNAIELKVVHGVGHGWPTMTLDIRRFADWFDRQLNPTP